MKRTTLLKIWIVLFILTITVALFSVFYQDKSSIIKFIILISFMKFLLISFYFMELKKAHSFWKSAIIVYLFLFSVFVFFS